MMVFLDQLILCTVYSIGKIQSQERFKLMKFNQIVTEYSNL